MGALKKLASDTALYGVSTILGRMANYLLVIPHTKALSTASYGMISDIYIDVAFMNILFTFGMETTYFRYANKEGMDANAAYHQTFTWTMLIATLGFLGLWTMLPVYSEARSIPIATTVLIWPIITLWVDAVLAIPFARLRKDNKPRAFAFGKLAGIGGNILFTFWFLIWQPNASALPVETLIGYVFMANLLGNLLQVPFLLTSLKQLRLRFQPALAKQMVVYAWPVAVMGVAGIANEMLGRKLFTYALPSWYYPGKSTEEAFGIYSACYKLSIFMQLVIQAFRYAAEPFFFSQGNKANPQALYAKVMTWFVVACAFILLNISLLKEVIAPLLLRRPEYLEGLGVVPILLAANLFLGMYYNLSIWYKLTDRTHFGTWLTLFGVLVTVLANLVLIPVLGYMGSALATLACYGAMAIASYATGQKFYPVPYQLTLMGLLIGTAFGIGLLPQLLSISSLWVLAALLVGGNATLALITWKGAGNPLALIRRS